MKENVKFYRCPICGNIVGLIDGDMSRVICCGKPMLVSDVSDNSVMVKSGINGYVFNPLSIESMADAIERYTLEMHSRRNEISKINRMHIEKICSCESFLAKYLKIIK